MVGAMVKLRVGVNRVTYRLDIKTHRLVSINKHIVEIGSNTNIPISTEPFSAYLLPPMTKQIAANWKWCFTFNNYTEVDIVDIVDAFSNHKDIMYFFRKEIGEQGTPHLQGLVWCTRRTSKGRRAAFRPFTLTKNKRIHWEPLKSSVQQHVDYCGGYGDHSEKSGTGGDVYTNMTPEWESLAQREERALKVAAQQQQQLEQQAEKDYDEMKPYIEMIRCNKTCSELWRKGHHMIDDYINNGPSYYMFWDVLSGGVCKNIEEWMEWERQWLDV